MELLIVLFVGVAGFAAYRSRLVAAAARAPTPQPVPGASAGSFIEIPFIEAFVEEEIIAPAVDLFTAGAEAEEIRGTWEQKVQEVLDRGLCDDLIREGADRAAVMVKIISILGVPPGEWKGTPGMTWGTRVSIEDRIALVAGPEPEPMITLVELQEEVPEIWGIPITWN